MKNIAKSFTFLYKFIPFSMIKLNTKKIEIRKFNKKFKKLLKFDCYISEKILSKTSAKSKDFRFKATFWR